MKKDLLENKDYGTIRQSQNNEKEEKKKEGKNHKYFRNV